MNDELLFPDITLILLFSPDNDRSLLYLYQCLSFNHSLSLVMTSDCSRLFQAIVRFCWVVLPCSETLEVLYGTVVNTLP